ncbi:hypothetical protein D9M71_800750 [compost metagenome]
MAAAECNAVAVVQRHAVVRQAPAVDEGAVGAAQVFHERHAALQVHVRVPARQVVDLLRIVVAIACEGIVGLADQVREAVDMDRLQPDIAAFRQQR